MSDIHHTGSTGVSSLTWARSEPSGEEGRERVRSDESAESAAPQEARELEEEERRLPQGDLEPLEYYRAEDPEALARAIERLEDFMKSVSRDLEFRVDDATGKTVVTVYVSSTDEVVRQIPPEEMLAIAERMREVQGILFNGQA